MCFLNIRLQRVIQTIVFFYCSLLGGLLSLEIFYKRDYNLEICIEWVNYQPIIGWVMICACFGAFGMRGVFPDPKWGSWSCCFALPFWGMKKTRMFRCIWSIHPFSKDPFPMQTLVSERILESIVLKSSVEPSKRSKMMFLPTGFVASNPWLFFHVGCFYIPSSYKANTI